MMMMMRVISSFVFVVLRVQVDESCLLKQNDKCAKGNCRVCLCT